MSSTTVKFKLIAPSQGKAKPIVNEALNRLSESRATVELEVNELVPGKPSTAMSIVNWSCSKGVLKSRAVLKVRARKSYLPGIGVTLTFRMLMGKSQSPRPRPEMVCVWEYVLVRSALAGVLMR